MNYKEEVLAINKKKEILVKKAKKATIEEKRKLLEKYDTLNKQKDSILKKLEFCKELTWWGYNEETFIKKFKEKFNNINITKALNTREFLIKKIII